MSLENPATPSESVGEIVLRTTREGAIIAVFWLCNK
jgi:hypothetical protein